MKIKVTKQFTNTNNLLVNQDVLILQT